MDLITKMIKYNKLQNSLNRIQNKPAHVQFISTLQFSLVQETTKQTILKYYGCIQVGGVGVYDIFIANAYTQ